MTEWPVLASMSVEDRSELLRKGRRRRFAKGETLFHHGDPGDSLYLLATGRVAVRVLTRRATRRFSEFSVPGRSSGSSL